MNEPANNDKPVRTSPGHSDALSDATKNMKSLENQGRELTRGADALYLTLRFFVRSFTRLYWRASIVDDHNMPASGPLILAPVHRSNLDVPLVGAASPRRLRYLAKGSLFRTRFWAWFLSALGGFPLDRDSSAPREALKASTEVLKRGEPLVVFPEGERKSGPRVQPLLDGAVWLSSRTGAPIVPMAIGASERALPKGANIPKPTKLVFLFGEPIAPPVPANGKRVSRGEITAATAELRVILQDLFDDAQQRAGWPNPPYTPDPTDAP